MPMSLTFSGAGNLDSSSSLELVDHPLSVTQTGLDPPIVNLSIVEGLKAIWQDTPSYRRLLACRGSDAQALLDTFQTLLDDGSFNEARRSLVIAMERLSGLNNIYPRGFELEGIQLLGDEPVAGGGYADIYKGIFRGRVVCLKMIRVYDLAEVEHLQKAFAHEVILWRQLMHENLLPFIGLSRTRSRLCFVSPWAQSGHVIKYLRANPDANRVLLCLDVAYGLRYLHENDIIHGDLKGANILINDSLRACVADFGLSSVSDPHILHWTSQSSAASKGGTARWQAPELFDAREKVVHNSAASDLYAWACVCYEIFTGFIPFYEWTNDVGVITAVKDGARPTPPPRWSLSWTDWGLTDKIWAIMEECWRYDPKTRPTIDEIVSRFLDFGIVDTRPAHVMGMESVRWNEELLSSHPAALNVINDILHLQHKRVVRIPPLSRSPSPFESTPSIVKTAPGPQRPMVSTMSYPPAPSAQQSSRRAGRLLCCWTGFSA